MEESRRLCYVGITRAKETLFMTSAEVRRVFGKTVAYPQSDFINEIKLELKEYVGVEKANIKSRASIIKSNSYTNPHSLRNSVTSNRAYTPDNGGINNIIDKNAMAAAAAEFITTSEATLGRKVVHEKFGVGTIVAVQDSGNDKKLTVAFDKQGIKSLLLSMAKLKEI